jgi:hypothetical protein
LKQKLLAVFAVGVFVAVACVPVFAHHGAAAYDVSKKVTVKGTVKQWYWVNPHCVLLVDTTDDAGQIVHWSLETQNPLSMANLGWSNDSFKQGDQVTVSLTPAKNGRPIGLIVDVVLANGQKLNARNILVDPSKTSGPPKQ